MITVLGATVTVLPAVLISLVILGLILAGAFLVLRGVGGEYFRRRSRGERDRDTLQRRQRLSNIRVRPFPWN